MGCALFNGFKCRFILQNIAGAEWADVRAGIDEAND
ncbi:hypothetical protein DJ90_2963 [Paenibacillus macerans]|uniref:Uncharacterized protein n=1 Tax=Paenibacillus macerans TaxID=44252 RepID=A0A090Y408_PAEMA|nr:hypothetical protein DJ90_2963 [Paenibacillus macerans]